MFVYIWKRNDGSGLLDEEFRDGDVMLVRPDLTNTGTPETPVWTPTEELIGTQERKSWLIVKVATPPNFEQFKANVERPEYAAGPSPDENVIRRARAYAVPGWRAKFDAAERAILEASVENLPDGPDVEDGIVQNRFGLGDISRK